MYKNNYEKLMAEMTPQIMARIMMCPYEFDSDVKEEKCEQADNHCYGCCEEYLMSGVEDDA